MHKIGIWFLLSLITVITFGQEKQKIILDTDLGDDIDDAFAMVQALSSEKFEILGICMAYANTESRAPIALRMLYEAGLDSVPIYLGEKTSNYPAVQAEWGEGFYQLQPQEQPAAEFIVEKLNAYPGEVILFTVGPVPTMKDVVDIDPDALSKAKHIYSMFGAFTQHIKEWNVIGDIEASQVFTTHTNNNISFSGIEVASVQWGKDKVNEVDTMNTPLTVAMMDLRDLWDQNTPWSNPTLFDCTALAMFLWPDLFVTRNVYMYVDDEGYTLIDEEKEPNCEIAVSIDEDEFNKRLMDLYLTQNYRRDSYICLSTIIDGIGDVSPRRGTFGEYSAVELTATGNSSWTFVGWSGDYTGVDNPIMVPMNSDKLIKAKFIKENTKELIAYWKFDEGSGLQVADVSANGNNGTLTGSAVWVDGISGTAIDFNATTNVHMKTVDGSTFSNQEFTINMWIKWPRGITSGWKTLVEFNRTFGTDHWGLFTHANGDALHFRDGIEYVAFTPELSEWYNISVSVATDGNVILYVNGEVLAEGEADPRTISEGLLTIGANNVGTEISNAIIDEVRIYNIGLSQTEIQNIINPGTSWTLSTKVIGSGEIELSPSGNTYADGTTVELKAIPDKGWHFTGWSGSLTDTDNPAGIVMYLNKNIIANFEQDSISSIQETEVNDYAFQIFPNPVRDQTTISYNLLRASNVQLVIYNLKGEEIAILVNDKQQAGHYSYKWTPGNNMNLHIPNGVYFCKLQVDSYIQASRLHVVK